MRTRTTTILGTAAAVALTMALSVPASADLTTRCVGEGGAITVPTDLVVPRGKTCVLNGTVVQGDVRVARDANLIANDSVFEGRLTVTSNGYLETWGSDVSGRVVLRGAFGSFMTNSDFGDNVVVRGDGIEPGFLSTLDTNVDGRVVVDTGELLLESSSVGGNVIARDSLYADVYDSFIDGRLRVSGSELGAVVCFSAVQGKSDLTGNSFGVQLGGDGPLVDCGGSNFWGSDVSVVDNADDVFIDGNIISGDLTLEGNAPLAVLGQSNMVRGDIIGEHGTASDVAGFSAMDSVSSADAQRAEAVSDRKQAVDEKVDERHEAAMDAAEKAGRAF